MRFRALELHFYGSRRHVANENPNTIIMQVDDVDAVNGAFSAGLKASVGKIPRGGIPKITKVSDLVDDRRFTLTDPGGNTIYVLMPNPKGHINSLRTVENEDHAKDYAILYDLMYSKEDKRVAANMLPRALAFLDKLVAMDIRKQ